MKIYLSLFVFCLILVPFSQMTISFANLDTQYSISDDQPSVILSESSNSGLQNSSWPMKCHDTRHTSQSPYSTRDNPHTEKWRFRTGWAGIESGPVIGEDGTIYFGSGGSDRKLYAINPDGTKKWHYQLDNFIWRSSPAIAEDGTIYITAWDNHLTAIHSNGTRKWKYHLGGQSSSPAIDKNGTIYCGSTSGFIFAINPNGSLKWKYKTDGWTMSDPAIGTDGTIYIGSEDHYLYALYPNGTLRWRFLTDDKVRGHPSIASDGTIYIPSAGNYLFAVNPDGTEKWRFKGGESVGSAAIASDGTVYIGSGRLYALHPNGTLKWSNGFGTSFSSPAISSDGTVYVANKYYLIAVDPSDGGEIWRKQIANEKLRSSPCIADDGTIYVGSSWKKELNPDGWGFLHAFGPASLSVDAGGPYQRVAGGEIQFWSTTLGGSLPYSWIWDFGDGNTSTEEHPCHTYQLSGNYTVILKVTDGSGNTSSDTAVAHIDTGYPTVHIMKPRYKLYFFNIPLFSWRIPFIIGNIDIEVEAYHNELEIARVYFLIDRSIKFIDEDEPFCWTWTEHVDPFQAHEIYVSAETTDGKGYYDKIEHVRKIL